MDLAEYNRRMDAATKAHAKAGDVQRKAVAKADRIKDESTRKLAYDAATQSYAAATQDYGHTMSALATARYGG